MRLNFFFMDILRIDTLLKIWVYLAFCFKNKINIIVLYACIIIYIQNYYI